MINYFVYRINVNYDGFTPLKIPFRRSGSRLPFNWTAYLESLDVGDIVLVYFWGGKCKSGIYALGRISKIDLDRRIRNVKADLIEFRANDQNPLISHENNKDLFDSLFSLRRRGSEILVSKDFESQIFELLKENERILHRCARLGIVLPGSPEFPEYDITEVPLLDLEDDVSELIRDREIISAYLIRPSQASWIKRTPNSLLDITYAFSRFKKGDMCNVQLFADGIVDQLRKSATKIKSKYLLITGVPLCQNKLKAGETDRVARLAKAVADGLDLSYENIFVLNGRVSRRLYKLVGHSTDKFIADYKENLKIRKRSILREIASSGKDLLLIDDVYTDGITTSTIINSCRHIPGCENLKITVATLGLMLKKRNIADKLLRRFSNDN